MGSISTSRRFGMFSNKLKYNAKIPKNNKAEPLDMQ